MLGKNSFLFRSLTGECCAPFLRVSPATVPPERAPTVAGGHLRHSGTSASDAPPLRRRNVMPLAMRPLREQTAHCRRTSVLPEALTRSPPVAAPTPNKRSSCKGELIFVTLTGLQGFSRLTHSAERCAPLYKKRRLVLKNDRKTPFYGKCSKTIERFWGVAEGRKACRLARVSALAYTVNIFKVAGESLRRKD